MKVLMTGSHGFVGTNLIEALSGGYELIRWEILWMITCQIGVW